MRIFNQSNDDDDDDDDQNESLMISRNQQVIRRNDWIGEFFGLPTIHKSFNAIKWGENEDDAYVLHGITRDNLLQVTFSVANDNKNTPWMMVPNAVDAAHHLPLAHSLSLVFSFSVDKLREYFGILNIVTTEKLRREQIPSQKQSYFCFACCQQTY